MSELVPGPRTARDDRGELVGLDAARSLVLGLLRPLDPAERPIERSRGCRLAADVIAPIPIPTFDNAAMDGFAVCTSSCDSGGGIITCTRYWPISTGMPIPAGADSIVPIEAVHGRGEGRLQVDSMPRPGDHLRRAGEELAAGALVLQRRTKLTPAAIGLLSSLGLVSVSVMPPPRVAIIVTGDEVVAPGVPLPEGRIYDADGPLCRALVEEAGGEVVAFERLPDDADRIGRCVERLAADADVIFSTGGASVGTRDHLIDQVRRRGSLVIHQLAIKPARPTSMGFVGRCAVFILPGNPLAVLVGFEALARPALRRLVDELEVLRPRVRGVARQAIPHRRDRLELVPIRVLDGDPPGVQTASSRRGSAVLSGAAVADGLALLEADRGDIATGDPLTIECWV
jgi:molybdopterin molybdotransferase